MAFGRSTAAAYRRAANPPGPLPAVGWIAVAAFLLVLFWASVSTLVALYDVPLPWAFLLSTVQCGSVAIAVVRPVVATALQLASVLTMGFATAPSLEHPWPLPVAGLIALAAFLALIGTRRSWIVSIAVWWSSFAVLVVSIVLNRQWAQDADRWGYNLLIDVTASLLVLGASVAVGQRRIIRAELAEAHRDVELEQARRRYGEERSRLARELHDVVAHSMSIVHIQATSAKFRLEGLDDRTAEEFDGIARSARTALREMRQLLGALRPDGDMGGDSSELAPQPQLFDLPALTSGAASVGTSVTLVLRGETGQFTPVIQLTVYRIVQEAVSNAVRHAPGATTTVSLVSLRQEAVVTIVNERPVSDARSADSGGMGLVGMAERVSLLGGTLEHGPTPDGGFRVVARIPLEPPPPGGSE